MQEQEFYDEDGLYDQTPTEIGPQHILLAIAGALAGAGVGGAIWFALAVFAGLEIGWLAVGIGGLAGFGAHTLSKCEGLIFQIIAAGCALGVFFLTKAAIILWVAKDMTGTWFDPSLMGLYQEAYIGSFGLFDVLWIGLVGYSAWAQLSSD